MKRTKDHNPFYVITGGPGVGKTTLLQELEHRGLTVVPEIARELIKEQQAIDGEALPWKNKKHYMKLMFDRSLESYEKATQDFKDGNPVIFDRGFLDSLCYASLEGIAITPEMKNHAEHSRYNAQVFILPPWREKYETDAQRKQTWNEAVFTYNKMIQTYRGYEYDLIEVPKATVTKRADFILEHIKEN